MCVEVGFVSQDCIILVLVECCPAIRVRLDRFSCVPAFAVLLAGFVSSDLGSLALGGRSLSLEFTAGGFRRLLHFVKYLPCLGWIGSESRRGARNVGSRRFLGAVVAVGGDLRPVGRGLSHDCSSAGAGSRAIATAASRSVITCVISERLWRSEAASSASRTRSAASASWAGSRAAA